MKKISVYIEIDSQYAENPIAMALQQILNVCGGDVWSKPVTDDDREADVAVVNTVNLALKIIKETEATKVVLVYFMKSEREMAEAFASRYVGRVTPVSYIGDSIDDEQALVPYLLNLVNPKGEEGDK